LAGARDAAYDLVLVGSGFASTFFLVEYLAAAPESARVLVLERGPRRSWSWFRRNPSESKRNSLRWLRHRNPEKEWWHALAFGGGSNCWWGNTPRMLPEDFRLRSTYGVGEDWPLSYDELEEDYCRAEELLGVAGPSEQSPFPRSRPYPLPPHAWTDPDRALHRAHPGVPTVRGDLGSPDPVARLARRVQLDGQRDQCEGDRRRRDGASAHGACTPAAGSRELGTYVPRGRGSNDFLGGERGGAAPRGRHPAVGARHSVVGIEAGPPHATFSPRCASRGP